MVVACTGLPTIAEKSRNLTMRDEVCAKIGSLRIRCAGAAGTQPVWTAALKTTEGILVANFGATKTQAVWTGLKERVEFTS